MKIVKIKAAGLRGCTPEGGWSNEIKPQDCVHTLVAVFTDEGITGWGSVFTNDRLVHAALQVLEPLYAGESPLEPERVSEKLHAHTFWMGRGGTITHTISGIDIAMWDILGKATGQPVGRLLGGCYRTRVLPYASLLMCEPSALAERLAALGEQGFKAFKIGWGPFGRQSDAVDERIVKAARESVGPEARLMVDAGASDACWHQHFKWAARTASMLADFGVYWFEEPLVPDNLSDYVLLRQNAPLPIAGGEVLTRRQSFTPFLQARAFDIVQPDVTKVGASVKSARLLGWPKRMAFASFHTDGTRRWDWLLICISRLQLETRTWWSTSPVLLLLMTSSKRSGNWTKTHACDT
jgi:L-alanine-DL-glutamate epimerase-like enolase superfamily enzyme